MSSFQLSAIDIIILTFATSIFLVAVSSTKHVSMHSNCPKVCSCYMLENLTEVDCSHGVLTSIPILPRTTEYLFLDYNWLNIISARAFLQVPMLKNLSLTYNSIYSIQPFAFDGLEKLSTINLHENALEELVNRSFANIPRLKYLFLTKNILKTIAPDAFFGSCEISEIFMYSNQLSSIPSVGHQPQLEYLELSYNHIVNATFPSSYRNSYKNISIGLNGNRLKIDKFSFSSLAGSTIFDLSLNMNDLSTVTFNGISTIKNLYLKHNCLNELSFNSETFTGIKVLELYLKDNLFTNFPKNLPTSLELLDFTQNQIRWIISNEISYLSNLKTLLLAENSIVNVAGKLVLKNLNKLDLSVNLIDYISNDLFQPLENLTYLSIGHNRLDDHFTKPFDSLKSLRVLHIEGNCFGCLKVPQDIFRQIPSLHVLHLEQNNLDGIFSSAVSKTRRGQLFSGLKNLKELYISRNNIRNVSDLLFQDLISLEILKMDTNRLSGWGSRLFRFTRNLRVLDVSRNLISRLSEKNVKYLQNLTVLNLSDNPFICNCELLWFRGWMESTFIVLENKENYTCHGPEEWREKPFLEFTEDKIDCFRVSSLSKYTIVGFVSATLVICAVFGCSLYRYRWRLRLRAYLISRRGREFLRNVRAQTANYGAINYESQDNYDAYISCSEHDNDWVLQNLLPGIDRGSYDDNIIFGGDFKLYFDPRDFDPGVSQVANIFEHMSRSRKMIAILTEHYCNGMTVFELDQATTLYHEHELQEIIVVKVGDVPTRMVPRNFYSQMRNGTFIEWEDNNDAIHMFKKKLRERLSSTRDHTIT